MPQHTKTPEERFLALCSKQSPPGCWIWHGSLTDFGHGQLYFRGRVWRAHRVSYTLYVGEIPAGLCACHKCDVPACVNPEHLFLGTKKQNSEDMVAKRRSMAGEAAPWAKNTNKTVAEIRARYAAGGITQRELSVLFGVDQAQISRYIRDKTNFKPDPT